MPEIPDLNVFQKNLAKKLVGKKLEKIEFLITRQLKIPASAFQETLQGTKLKEVVRIGKELHFEFQNGHVLGLHLMLHGALHWFEVKNDNRFTIAELYFNNGTGLAITDWQKAVMLKLDPELSSAPDALKVTSRYFEATLKMSSRPIKTVLVEGKTVQGIGNAYADEILYAAGISPFSAADKLTSEAIATLTKSIKSVLKEAEKHIERNFPDTISEKERDFLQVHRPKQKVTLAGEKILRADIDKRKTYYTVKQHVFE
ncbi:DNA-formamidopyrimidine glycosylase family protein [Mucilaginibacter ginkgonis]|uniref:Fpg/Nei family DNA glycosylase n=1 Tax=Mucilaginibacter ginkgonis TaxID=2682091 RepID=A0A6I4HZ40_9SPHI|nr:DNA-formamidopyrimidine glycosylase family protein [Mucilaginibacter ginkgonis]QQL50139.1 Fpg/Nei family DNA glycosylase [Mucilaginibacter ginkgonis]